MSREREAWTRFFEEKIDPNRKERVTRIAFTVDCKAAPQGSMGGIAITRADGTPATILKADNPRTHPYRRQVGWQALQARAAAGIHDVFAPMPAPVCLNITFVLARPKSAEAARVRPIAKPDLDKLTRSTADALKGILWTDDSQVVDSEQHKIYGTPECVHVCVSLVENT